MKETGASQILAEVQLLKSKGFSRGRPFVVSRANKISSVAHESNAIVTSDLALKAWIDERALSPTVLLGAIFSDYEKLMKMTTKPALHRLANRICWRLAANVSRMKEMLATTSDSTEKNATQMAQAFEQIYLLLIQYGSEIPDSLLLTRACQSLPHHPRSRSHFFLGSAAMGDVVSATRRFQKDERSLQPLLFQFVSRFLSFSESVKLEVVKDWLLLLPEQSQYSTTSAPSQQLVALFHQISQFPSSCSRNSSSSLTDADLAQKLASRTLLPIQIQRSEPLQRIAASLLLTKRLFEEIQILMQYTRYGTAQLKLQLLRNQIQALLSSRERVWQWFEEDLPILFNGYEKQQWQQDYQQFLEYCVFRYSINMAICKVYRQTRVMSESEMTKSIMTMAGKEYLSLLPPPPAKK